MRYTTSDWPIYRKAHRGPNKQRFGLTEQAPTDTLDYFNARRAILVTPTVQRCSAPLEGMDAAARLFCAFAIAIQLENEQAFSRCDSRGRRKNRPFRRKNPAS